LESEPEWVAQGQWDAPRLGRWAVFREEAWHQATRTPAWAAASVSAVALPGLDAMVPA
jgi:hypothetical protein